MKTWRWPHKSPEGDRVAVDDVVRYMEAEGLAFEEIRGWMAYCSLLKDQGELDGVEFGDDEDSRQFVEDVRELNQGWKPGELPTVPKPITRMIKAPVVHVPEQTREEARPRERRVRRSRGSASRGDPSEPPPARPPLTPAERLWLKTEVDARRREMIDAQARLERVAKQRQTKAEKLLAWSLSLDQRAGQDRRGGHRPSGGTPDPAVASREKNSPAVRS